MKKEIWGFNVIGPQGLDARNDFAVGPNDEGDDVILRVNQAELTGREFETLKEIAEGGPTPGGGGFPEQDLDDPTFVPEANHYYKQKSGEKPKPVMTPIEIGQEFNDGDQLHFDITQTETLHNFLANLTHDDPAYGSDGIYNLATDLLLIVEGSEYGTTGNVLCAVDANNPVIGAKPIYATEAGSMIDGGLDFSWEAGWQNLDSDGNFVLFTDGYHITVSEINDSEVWNGTIIGTLEEPPASQYVDGVIYFYDGEEYHAITGEGGEGTLDYNKLENIPIINLTENKTTVLSPFEIGQVLNSESILHIDTNKEEEFLSYLQTLEYPEQIPIAAFMRAKRTADSASIVLLVQYQDNIYRFGIGRVGEESKMIYVSQDFYDEETGTQYYKGFQNLDANGNLQFTQLLTPADGDFIIDRIVDTTPPTWNGTIISAVTEETVVSPTPVDGEFYKRNGQIYKYTAAKPGELGAFAVGDVFTEGTKIHFDTTKETELLVALHNLTWMSEDDISVALMIGVEGNQDAMIAYLISGVTYLVGLAPDIGKPTIVYASEAGEWAGLTFVAGFQNLDENGDIIYENERPITSIDDPNNEWNGTIIGKMGESQPELYDKVVLESELGDGSGAVVIDLGELPIQEGKTNVKVDITEEQFNLANNNDNVVVKAFINLGDAEYVYLPKVVTLPAGESTAESMFATSFEGMKFFAGLFYNNHQGKYVCEFNIQEDSGDDTQLYRHTIIISPSTGSMLGQLHCNLTFVSTRSTAYTNNDVKALVDDLGSMVAVSGAAIYNGSIAVLERARFQDPLSSSQLIGKYFVLNTDAQVSYMSDYYIDNIPEMSIYQDTVQPIQ